MSRSKAERDLSLPNYSKKPKLTGVFLLLFFSPDNFRGNVLPTEQYASTNLQSIFYIDFDLQALNFVQQ